MLEFKTKTVKVSEIKIPNRFETTYPLTNKIAECYEHYRKHEFFDRAIIVDKSGMLLDGYVAYLVARMLGIEQVKAVRVSGIEYNRSQFGTEYHPQEVKFQPDKPEPIKLYCVRDFEPGKWLTKGKIYESTPDFSVTYDDGYKSDGGYSSLKQFHVDNKYTGAPLWPLVKRPAKVGEWVYVTKQGGQDTHPAGTVGEVTSNGEGFPSWVRLNGLTHSLIRNDQYLVLDGWDGPEDAHDGVRT